MNTENDNITSKTVHIPLTVQEEEAFEKMLRDNAQKKSFYIKLLIVKDLAAHGYNTQGGKTNG